MILKFSIPPPPKAFLYVPPLQMPSFMFLWKEISKSIFSCGNHQKFLPAPSPPPPPTGGAACKDQTHVSNLEEDHHMIDSCKETTQTTRISIADNLRIGWPRKFRETKFLGISCYFYFVFSRKFWRKFRGMRHKT
jgi:hypothetical protein